MALLHFLLVYDLNRRELLEQEPYDDAEEAAAAYADAEAKYRGRDDLEVVLVGADSIETIRRTHAHYFDKSGTVSPYLPA